VSEQSYFEEAARMHATLKQLMPDTYAMNHNAHLINHIHPSAVIEADEVALGVGVTIGANVVIKARKVVIGDFVTVGDGCKFFVPELRIGDYSRLGDLVLGIGTKPMLLGRNLYVGRLVRLDSRGGLEIQDNVGIGDSSAIWTHIRHGDVVQGCRWDKEYPLVIEHDAWLVAKVTVGGCQRIGARAMIFNESNVTKREIPPDTVWKGNNPIEDVTAKVGPQFETHPDPIIDLFQKQDRLDAEIDRFNDERPDLPDVLFSGMPNADARQEHITYFNVRDRTYTKRRTAAEVAFLRYTLAKFVPLGDE
jgi:acetyltransferase-like isoleucine patch superfamily enzyme